jgi:hypothetical protein
MLVIADTFSRLGSIPRRETIYLTNLHEGMLRVHLSGFILILYFSQVVKCLYQVRDESFIFPSLNDMSSMYALALFPS